MLGQGDQTALEFRRSLYAHRPSGGAQGTAACLNGIRFGFRGDKETAGVAELESQAALFAQDLLRLAAPCGRERHLAAAGLVIGHALGAVAAALAGVDNKQGIGFVQAVFPGHVVRQDHNARPLEFL